MKKCILTIIATLAPLSVSYAAVGHKKTPKASTGAALPAEKKTYMDCQTSSQSFKRVVLKAQKKNDVLSQFEVILVDDEGKSHAYMASESLDSRYLDPQTMQSKNIQIVGRSKETIESSGVISNPTAVNLFQNESAIEDMACLSVQHRAGQQVLDGDPLKNKKLLRELKYHKFSGTLFHKNQLIQLSCFSPMIPRESNCGLNTDTRTAGDSDLNSL